MIPDELIPGDEASVPFAAGISLAAILLGFWKFMSEENHRILKKRFPYHHGLYGIVISAMGMTLSESCAMGRIGRLLKGLGSTLMADDMEDLEQWLSRIEFGSSMSFPNFSSKLKELPGFNAFTDNLRELYAALNPEPEPLP